VPEHIRLKPQRFHHLSPVAFATRVGFATRSLGSAATNGMATRYRTGAIRWTRPAEFAQPSSFRRHCWRAANSLH